MKVAMIVIGVVLGGIAAIALTLFLMFQSVYDNAIEYEAQIQRLNSESEAVLSSVTIKVQTAAGITGTYANDLKDIVQASMEGRYGEHGSQAVMQWIQEQNPTVDSSLYLKVQNIVDGGQSEFLISQKRKLEVCTNYETIRGYFVRGSFLRMIGFPKKGIDDLCKVISDELTRQAFETGLQKPLITR